MVGPVDAIVVNAAPAMPAIPQLAIPEVAARGRTQVAVRWRWALGEKRRRPIPVA